MNIDIDLLALNLKVRHPRCVRIIMQNSSIYISIYIYIYIYQIN